MKRDNYIAYNEVARHEFQIMLDTASKEDAKLFVLADSNTYAKCYPLLQQIGADFAKLFIPIIISPGEKEKNLENATFIWDRLSFHGADRSSILINLGGGMITDIGGFCASCYKRGIRTIHIPTSLLAMVDAAIGGKTGVDFKYYKNQIGTFYLPEAVYIFTDFLKSLPQQELLSGFGEVIKYSLISNSQLEKIFPKTLSAEKINQELIELCVDIKLAVTKEDPKESGLRKILNFGHSIGHALESFALEKGIPLTHGEAVAAGMLTTLWLSVQIIKLPDDSLRQFETIYQSYFSKIDFNKHDVPHILFLMQHDKKNKGNKKQFVLLQKPGKPVYDIVVEDDLIEQALRYYISL